MSTEIKASGRAASIRFDHGHDAPDLLFLGDRVGAGAGGFSPDVYDAGPLVEHGGGVLGRGFGVEEVAAVGEGVGGDVEDADDDGAGTRGRSPGPWGVAGRLCAAHF